MIIETTGNRCLTVHGPTPKRVVYKLMKMDFIVFTKTDYMREVKERVKVLYDADIDFEKKRLRTIPEGT